MSMQEITTIGITAVVTGGVSTFCTVVALKVHIDYLREHVKRLESGMTRAHQRIDDLVMVDQ